MFNKNRDMIMTRLIEPLVSLYIQWLPQRHTLLVPILFIYQIYVCTVFYSYWTDSTKTELLSIHNGRLYNRGSAWLDGGDCHR